MSRAAHAVAKANTAVAHAAPPAPGSRAPGATPAPSLIPWYMTYLRVTKLVRAMRMDIDALVRPPSACFLSVPPPQLPLENGHGEHLLSERRLVMEHRPRACQMSVRGHSGARMERPERRDQLTYLWPV
jgi:hypothetical protein